MLREGRTTRLGSLCLGVVLVAALAVSRGSAADVGPSSLHDPFDRILKDFVDDRGRVAYRDLEKRAGAALRAYLKALAEMDPTKLPERDRIAFWINAYNAHAIHGVLQGYSAEGVIARKRFFSWFEFRLAGSDRTLGEIEHEILRVKFTEPRIHFALVCASTSCPQLRREAFRGADLSAQLDDQARRFLNDPTRNLFPASGALRLSRIFEWFAEDFEKAAGTTLEYLRKYRDIDGDRTIEYLEYDWTMNAQPGQRPA